MALQAAAATMNLTAAGHFADFKKRLTGLGGQPAVPDLDFAVDVKCQHRVRGGPYLRQSAFQLSSLSVCHHVRQLHWHTSVSRCRCPRSIVIAKPPLEKAHVILRACSRAALITLLSEPQFRPRSL